jgi:hypothetical protein
MTIHDDSNIHYWCVEAAGRGGDFVKSIAHAALRADVGNYEILRPALLQFLTKYPAYLKGFDESS